MVLWLSDCMAVNETAPQARILICNDVREFDVTGSSDNAEAEHAPKRG